MKLGLFSMPCHPPHRKHADTFDEDLELLVLADQLGFDEAWLGEHYTSTWENIPAPDLTLAQKERVLGGNAVEFFGLTNLPDPNALRTARSGWTREEPVGAQGALR